MKHFSYAINDLNSLQSILDYTEIDSLANTSQSILVQIYSAQLNVDWIKTLCLAIEEKWTKVIIVGATSIGEILNGLSLTEQTIIGFTFFAQSQLFAIAQSCILGEEVEQGKMITDFVNQISCEVKALLLLTTPLSINVTDLLGSIKLKHKQVPLFGGGAGNYTFSHHTTVFKGPEAFHQGFVVVVFAGATLEVKANDYLGWRTLSKSMIITGIEDSWVTQVDNKPAFDVYQNYLNIKNDQDFFINALEFPFLLKRGQQLIARVPIAVDDNGALQFVADIKVNETFRLGYGDPNAIIKQAKFSQEQMHNFAPEAIFMYACGCRRFLMQDDIQLETLPFQTIAPSFGFYTYGEYSGHTTNLELLNSAMVVIGLREGPVSQVPALPYIFSAAELNGPNAKSHARVISRLVTFISNVTQELEQANSELLKINATEIAKQKTLREEYICFITMLGHEIRTPLSIIDSIVQNLEFEVVEDKNLIATSYKGIRQASNRLNNLIDDILIEERFDLENSLLRVETWQVIDLLGGVLLQYDQFLPDELKLDTCVIELALDTVMIKKLIITCSNYYAPFQGDLGLLNIVVSNLIENAYKYGTPTTDILLTVEPRKESGMSFTISNQVEDFNSLYIDKLYDKYWRGSEKINIAGAGLGLYLTKHLVERHGGDINANLCKDYLVFDVNLP